MARRDLDAAVRELEEETGVRISAEELVGPILVRPVVHGYSDVVIDQEDVFFACWVPAFEVTDAGHTEEERLTMTAHRWWSRAELAATTEGNDMKLLTVAIDGKYWCVFRYEKDKNKPFVPEVEETNTVCVGSSDAVSFTAPAPTPSSLRAALASSTTVENTQ